MSLVAQTLSAIPHYDANRSAEVNPHSEEPQHDNGFENIYERAIVFLDGKDLEVCNTESQKLPSFTLSTKLLNENLQKMFTRRGRKYHTANL